MQTLLQSPLSLAPRCGVIAKARDGKGGEGEGKEGGTFAELLLVAASASTEAAAGHFSLLLSFVLAPRSLSLSLCLSLSPLKREKESLGSPSEVSKLSRICWIEFGNCGPIRLLMSRRLTINRHNSVFSVSLFGI